MKKSILLFFILISVNVFAQRDGNAMALPDSLLGLLKEYRKPNEARAEVLDKVILYYKENGRILEAQPYIRELEFMSEEMKDNYWKAVCLYYKSNCAYEKYDFSEFLSLINEALQMTEILQDTKEVRLLTAKLYLIKSAYFRYSQQFSECHDCLEKGLQIAEDNGFEQIRNRLLNNYGVLLLELDRYEEAITQFKSLEDSEVNHSLTLYNLIVVYSNMKQYDSVFYYIDSLERYAAEADINDASVNKSLVDAYGVKAVCLNELGQWDEAIDVINLSNSLFDGSNDTEDLALNCFVMANSYSHKGELSKALEYVEESVKLSREISGLKLEWFGIKLKAVILHNMRDFEQEVDVLRYLMVLTDTINGRENLERIIEQKYQHEAKTKELEYELQQMASRQRLLLTILIASSSIIIIALVSNRILKRRKRKMEQLASELDLRNREITSKSIDSIHKNERLNLAIEKLSDMEQQSEGKVLPDVIHELKTLMNADAKKDFDLHFVQMHPHFYEKLLADYPQLTPSELRLCAFIKSNLCIKEIAAINGLSPESVKTARKRLRRSLDLTGKDVSLLEFLAKY